MQDIYNKTRNNTNVQIHLQSEIPFKWSNLSLFTSEQKGKEKEDSTKKVKKVHEKDECCVIAWTGRE
jgi:hypothetical protein